jgi:hypothetical protein
MPSVEKRQRLQGLIARITLNPEGLEIGIRTAHLADILRRGEEIGTCEPMTRPGEPVLVLTIAARLKRTGMEKKLLIGAANKRSGTKADAGLRYPRWHPLRKPWISATDGVFRNHNRQTGSSGPSRTLRAVSGAALGPRVKVMLI